MRIKHSARIATYAAIAADELGMKPSRAGWGVREKQAQRLARLLEVEDRPTNRKAKAGVQAITGRTRVERVEVEEVIERPIRVIYAEMVEVVRSIQQSATPATVRWSYNRHGCGLTVFCARYSTIIPSRNTYELSERGLSQLMEDYWSLVYLAIG